MTSADDAAVDGLFAEFVRTGRLPADFTLVQGRLVRHVYRGQLPSGPVHCKVMTFPRPKDRLRYALRALPAAHEAKMLTAVAAAGIPCPPVVAVRVRRHAGLPFRSLLVLRTLDLAPPDATEPKASRLADEAALALRLLAAGIVHRDLHSGNFVRLRDGRLGVLDLQSASLVGSARANRTRVRLAMAARLLRDRPTAERPRDVQTLVDVGLLRADESSRLERQVVRWQRRYSRSRYLRCFCESTEFTVRWHWTGREYRQRQAANDGRWVSGGGELRRAWIGQHALRMVHGRPAPFMAFFQKWWWLGGGGDLYVPAAWNDDRTALEVEAAAVGCQAATKEGENRIR